MYVRCTVTNYSLGDYNENHSLLEVTLRQQILREFFGPDFGAAFLLSDMRRD